MTISKTYTLTWWQIGIFKVALFSIGALIGSYWYSFFNPYFVPLIIVATLSNVYIWYIIFKQV